MLVVVLLSQAGGDCNGHGRGTDGDSDGSGHDGVGGRGCRTRVWLTCDEEWMERSGERHVGCTRVERTRVDGTREGVESWC